MIDLNNFQLINLSQFSDSLKFRSGSGSRYDLVIDFSIVMLHMLMILMKFPFVPQTFSDFFLRALLFVSPRLQRQSGLYVHICVMKNMIYSERSKLDFCLV